MAMQEADLIIALGTRLDDRVTGNVAKFAPAARAATAEGRGGIVHFEIMPKNINKVAQATEAVEGDVADNLTASIPHIKEVAARPEWLGQIDEWKKHFPFNAFSRDTSNGLIKSQVGIEELSKTDRAHRG